MTATFLPVAMVAYIAGIFAATLNSSRRSPAARSAASIGFVAGWVAHLAAVIQRGLETGQLPVTSLGEHLLLLGAAVMTLHLWLWFRWQADVVGLVLPPLVVAAGLAAWPLLGDGTPASRPGGMFLFHTTISTLGLAALVVALVMSVLVVVQDRALKKRRRVAWLERLPALQRCDEIGFQALATGFALFTIGIVTGGLVNLNTYGVWWRGGGKQIFPVMAWIIFAAVLFARLKTGFRGRRSAYWTITGVVLGLLTIAGMAV